MGWGNLRVINEDYIASGRGFGTHSHQDMEIISYVLSGSLAHKDNMGNGTSIVPGDVQRMSAGLGVTHSEFNQSENATTHFLQIWIKPHTFGVVPSYEQTGKLRLIVSPDGKDGSLRMHANASIYVGLLDHEDAMNLELDPERKAYVHLVRGQMSVNNKPLQGGDAALIESEKQLSLSDASDAEVLVFDLAP
jgi:quercetin 2,3-dioxygenase